MDPLTLITGAAAVTKKAVEIAREIKEMKGSEKVVKATSELYDVIIDLQGKIMEDREKAFQLIQRVQAAESDLKKVKHWEEISARYQLIEIGEGEGGIYLYELKADAANGQPIHYACPVCWRLQELSIIQKTHAGSSKRECPRCKLAFMPKKNRPHPVRVITGGNAMGNLLNW